MAAYFHHPLLYLSLLTSPPSHAGPTGRTSTLIDFLPSSFSSITPHLNRIPLPNSVEPRLNSTSQAIVLFSVRVFWKKVGNEANQRFNSSIKCLPPLYRCGQSLLIRQTLPSQTDRPAYHYCAQLVLYMLRRTDKSL